MPIVLCPCSLPISHTGHSCIHHPFPHTTLPIPIPWKHSDAGHTIPSYIAMQCTNKNMVTSLFLNMLRYTGLSFPPSPSLSPHPLLLPSFIFPPSSDLPYSVTVYRTVERSIKRHHDTSDHTHYHPLVMAQRGKISVSKIQLAGPISLVTCSCVSHNIPTWRTHNYHR